MPPRRPTAVAAPAEEPEEPVATTTIDMSTSNAAFQVFSGDIESVGNIYTDPAGKPLGLIARLAKIKESLPVIDPEGKNQHFNYKFVKNTQVLGVLRPRLARQLIMVVPETVEERDPIALKTKSGGDSLMTRITVTWRVVDGIDGESFTGQSVGYGDDGGDKGANKAFTAAQKNFLIRLFEIGGEPDIEDDAETDKRASARESGAKKVTNVVIGDTDVTGVKPGGKSEKATEVQIARVGQYVRDLELTPEGVASFADKVLGDQLELGDKPWDSIKDYLESLSGTDIGKLIARFDEVLNTPSETSVDDADPTNSYG